MLECKIDGTFDLDEIIRETQQGGEILAYATTRFKDYMNKYVPMSAGYLVDGVYIPPGNLRKSAKANPEEGTVSYNAPYAHAQYVGYTTGPVVNYTTPGTGKYWDELMATAEGDLFIKEIEEFTKRRMQ